MVNIVSMMYFKISSKYEEWDMFRDGYTTINHLNYKDGLGEEIKHFFLLYFIHLIIIIFRVLYRKHDKPRMRSSLAQWLSLS